MLPLWEDTKSKVRVGRLTLPEEIETLVRRLEEAALRQGWQLTDDLRRFSDRSVFFVLEVGEQLAGGLQLVRPDPSGALPYQELWPEVQCGIPGLSAHVIILALDKSVRGQSLLFWRLVVELWRFCVAEDIATLFLETTPRILPLYRRLGWSLQSRGELRRHWKGDCYLCTLSIAEVAAALLRRAGYSVYYRQIIAQAFRVTISAGRTGKKTLS